MANSDPFSSSVIPFEVPEQMRAFAEKGVSQARDSYAKFKDVAESHNGTIEAVFTSASKGYGEYCPVDEGHNEAAWEENRRVEFKIVKTADGPTGVELGCANATAHHVPPDPVP